MAEENFKRYRFSVPHADVSVNKWVEQQSNLSMSLRLLIGECIEKTGYVDYTCRERIPGARRGRPPKTDYANDDSDVVPGHEEPVVQAGAPTAPVVKPVVPAVKTPAQSGVLSDDDIAAMFN